METSAKFQETIKDLNDVVTMHRELNNLFRGGCCFAASVIAKECEKHDIPYKVLSYKGDYYNKKNATLEQLAHDCELTHVAIDIDGTIIGGEVSGGWYDLVKDYHENVSSADLKKIYENNIWNQIYNAELNEIIKQDIEMVFSMF